MSNVSAQEQDIEKTRDQLAATIDQLVYRASPKTIAARETAAIKARFVDPATGEPKTTNILIAVGSVAGVVALFVTLRKLSN